jgi:hypothetical protein
VRTHPFALIIRQWVLRVKGVVISLPPTALFEQSATFLAGRKEEKPMVDYFPTRSNHSHPPEPEPEAVDAAAQDATLDVVINYYKERRDAQSIAVRISFRLPEKA